MYPAPTPTPPGTKVEKPGLAGVRNKPRKGVTKANAKHEPTVFRDQLIKHLESVPPQDYDAVAAKLDALGNQLDYHKYEVEIFEVLLVGGLLAPGGGFIDDGATRSPFSVIGSAKEPVEVADVKKIVDVFNKLMRRYKYLQKPFEETALRGILQYTNKFTPVEQDKLAVATALFVTGALASASVLGALKKDHLVKDGTAFKFLIAFFKAYLATESLDHLTGSLRRGGVSDLELFLPANKQNPTEVANQLRAAGLGPIADNFVKIKSSQAKEELTHRLRELVSDNADADEIVSYLESKAKAGVIPPVDFISLVWNGLLHDFDFDTKPEEISAKVITRVDDDAALLEPFCEKATTQVALVNTIQLWCHDNPKVAPSFAKILKNLYSADVLSDQAILYWASKGAKPQGKDAFLKQAAPLVKFLSELEEEEDSDDE